MSPYIIGITGGSGSGKTRFIRCLLERYTPKDLCLISHDNYYRPREEQPVDQKGIYNFDKPESIDLSCFINDLQQLIGGKTVRVKEYTFNNPDQQPVMIELRPAPVIILEGIFIFHNQDISKLIDLRIFIDAPEHIMLKRRIERDQNERGYDLEDVLYRYEHHVMPAYRKYIEPFRETCDLIINNYRDFKNGLEVLESHISRILGK